MPKGLTTEEFVSRAREVHGDKYDYSKTRYKNFLTPVKMSCLQHGEFEQKPNNHLYGASCPKCARESVGVKLSLDTSEFINRAKKQFGNNYSYARSVYVGSRVPIIVTCDKHGDFRATPNAFLTGHSGCSSCSGSKLTSESFTARAKITHGERYDYTNSKVAGYHGIVKIACQEHGEFEQTPNNHLQGKGCPKCIGKMVSDTESFVMAAREVHGDKYDYTEAEYVTAVRKVKIACHKHGIFEQTPANHNGGNGCPKCSTKISKPETALFDFVISIAPDARRSDRTVISPQELDIVVPGAMVAIEFNGLYYHSDRNEGRKDSYHHDKMIAAKKTGYRLIQVWEDDWRDNRSVVEKTLKHILGVTDKKTFARKCEIVILSLRDVAQFFTSNHLQGCSRQGLAYALQSEGITVAAMIFHPVVSVRGASSDYRKWELGRFATAHSVVGGASRLFQAFVNDHQECEEVISYSDNDWFDGGMYEKLGFKHVANVSPDYKVVDAGRRRHKTGYKLATLEKRFGEKFNQLLSERENCRNNGLFRVYNSGLKKWVWRKS